MHTPAVCEVIITYPLRVGDVWVQDVELTVDLVRDMDSYKIDRWRVCGQRLDAMGRVTERDVNIDPARAETSTFSRFLVNQVPLFLRGAQATAQLEQEWRRFRAEIAIHRPARQYA